MSHPNFRVSCAKDTALLKNNFQFSHMSRMNPTAPLYIVPVALNVDTFKKDLDICSVLGLQCTTFPLFPNFLSSTILMVDYKSCHIQIKTNAISSLSWPNQKHNSSNEPRMDTKIQILWTNLSYVWSLSQFLIGVIHLLIACRISLVT